MCDPCMGTRYLTMHNSTDLNVTTCHALDGMGGPVDNTTQARLGLVWHTDLDTTGLNGADMRYDLTDLRHSDYTDLTCTDPKSGNATILSDDDLISNSTTSEYEHSLRFNHYSCPMGRVMICAFAGSEECGIPEPIPAIECQVGGVNYTVPESNVTTTTANQTEPEFYDAFEFSDRWRVGPYNGGQEASSDVGTWLRLYKMKKYTGMLMMSLYSPDNNDWWQELTGEGTIGDYHSVFNVRYIPPTGTLGALNLSTIEIDTQLVAGSALCGCTVLGSCHNYTLEYLVGFNETHFKGYNHTCLNGVWSLSSPNYTSNLTARLSSVQLNWVEYMTTFEENFMEPIYFDTGENTVNRFFMFWFDVQPGSRAIYEGDIRYGDNENFIITYNYTDWDLECIVTSEIVYGNYTYFCDIPSGFGDPDGDAQGNVTVDSPIENIKINYQRVCNLSAYITLFTQDSPALNTFCSFFHGFVTTANGTGVCEVTHLEPEAWINGTFSYGVYTKAADFYIHDYYNSPVTEDGQGYSLSETCGNFDCVYRYELDLASDGVTVIVDVRERGTEQVLDDVTIWWDGASIGATDGNGRAFLSVDAEFGLHNLTATHDCYYNASEEVVLQESGQMYLLYMDSRGECVAQFDDIESSGDVIAMFGSTDFLGAFIVIMAGVAGAPAGVAGIALAMGGSAVLLALVGFLSWFWAIPIVFLCVLVAAYGLTRVVKGGG